MSGVRDWLRRDDPEPDDDDDEEPTITVLDEIDELRQQSIERGDPKWFPRGGGPELVRLVGERRRRERQRSR